MTLQALVGDNFYEIGDRGPVIEVMQHALHDIGYPLSGTGYWANATDTAVRAFQKRAGLKVDGVLGESTAEAIDDAGMIHPIEHHAPVQIEIGRPLWLQAGLALVGTKEVPGSGDNPTILHWASDEHGDIAKEYTQDSIPWCALFANHCLTLATLPGTGTLWALDFAGNWPSVHLSGMAVGAFAPMVRNGGGHIIQIVGRAANGNIMGLGGNQHDMVSVAEFARSRLNKGFWWPKSVAPPALTGFENLPVVRSDGTVSSKES